MHSPGVKKKRFLHLGFWAQDLGFFPDQDGKKLLTASKDRTLCVWEVHEDTADGSSKNKKVPVASAKRTLRGHSDVVSQAILESGSWFIVKQSCASYSDKESIVLFPSWYRG